MTSPLFSGLLADLWTDLRNPAIIWQIGVLAACCGGGYVVAKSVRGWRAGARLRLRWLGGARIDKLLFPLISLGLIAASIPVLDVWQRANLLRAAVLLLGSLILIRLIFYFLRRILARAGEAGVLLLLFEKILAALIWLGVAIYVTGLWPDLLKYLESTVLPLGRNKISLLTILQAAVSVLVTLVLALWAGALLEQRLMRISTIHSSLRTVMARMGRAVLILVAVLLSLSLVGIDLTVLSVFGGALGVGIGLGLQKIVSSYVSGFVILLERSLAVGDMVNVDQYYGQVTQINTRYTVVRGGDGIETVVPNEMLVSGPVQNYSLTDRVSRIATRVRVGYETDIEAVLGYLQESVSKVNRVAKQPAPHALLIEFGPDGFVIEVGVWIADPENGRLNVLSEVNRAIWQTLQAHAIQIPYPQRELRWTGMQEGNANAGIDLPQTARLP
jgi:small-conductance mechanosensitive channel